MLYSKNKRVQKIGVDIMAQVSKMTRPYLAHDEDTRNDDKIKKIFFHFRKTSKEMNREELESIIPLGAYGIFWSILEYMHRNGFQDDDIYLLADELRINEIYIKNIINDFELFIKKDSQYISERLIKDLNNAAEKSKKKTEAVNRRWILSRLKKAYIDIFETEPVLNKTEIDTYIDYVDSIEDFENRLPDILYTTKLLKFKNNPDFHGSINWLLKENHLTTLLNGGYGEIKSWQKHIEYLNKKNSSPEDDTKEIDIDTISTKTDAIEYIKSHYKNNTGFISPPIKILMKKFDINQKDLSS